jgi:hypothetical protein
VLTRSSRIYAVATAPQALHTSVAVAGSDAFRDALRTKFGVDAVTLAADTPRVDTVVIDPAAGSRSLWTLSTLPAASVKSDLTANLFTQQAYGPARDLARFDGLANGSATVELYFIEPYFKEAGKRVFDVALNGATVLKEFDICKEAGPDTGIVKSFQVAVTGGSVDLSVPNVRLDNAIFAAVRVTDARGKAVRMLFGTRDFHDAQHDRWAPIHLVGYDWASDLPPILKRAHDDGTRVVIVANDKDGGDIGEACQELASEKIATYTGMPGVSDAPWMGRWYFAKTHWLLAGLPSDCVLDWPYQIASGNGVYLDAPGIEGVIGYGINHNPNPALGGAVIPFGKGQIVFVCLPGLAPSFISGRAMGLQPITATRLIYNALAGPR